MTYGNHHPVSDMDDDNVIRKLALIQVVPGLIGVHLRDARKDSGVAVQLLDASVPWR